MAADAEDRVVVARYARRALLEARGERVQAVKLLEEYGKQMPELHMAIMAPYESRAYLDAINGAAGYLRRHPEAGDEPPDAPLPASRPVAPLQAVIEDEETAVDGMGTVVSAASAESASARVPFRVQPWSTENREYADTARGLMSAPPAPSIFEMWTLPSGIRLGDATRKDLQEAIEFHRHQLAGHLRAIRFYEAVLKRLGKAQRVRDAITSADAEALRKQYHDRDARPGKCDAD